MKQRNVVDPTTTTISTSMLKHGNFNLSTRVDNIVYCVGNCLHCRSLSHYDQDKKKLIQFVILILKGLNCVSVDNCLRNVDKLKLPRFSIRVQSHVDLQRSF